MKIFMKWSVLTDAQQKQILSFYQEEIEKKELFEHDLNRRVFLINSTNGNFIARKDF